MEAITTKEKLVEQLKNVLSLEVSARDSYNKDIGIFRIKKIKDSITKIKNDEIRHIEILEKLIRMLEDNH